METNEVMTEVVEVVEENINKFEFKPEYLGVGAGAVVVVAGIGVAIAKRKQIAEKMKGLFKKNKKVYIFKADNSDNKVVEEKAE